MKLEHIDTPAALIDIPRMQKNIARMQGHMNALGVAFRPHVKTTKCIDVVRAQIAAGARGITVSTLKEAEAFFAAGVSDILYAVSIAPSKLPRALALRRQGCDLKLVVDNPTAAAAIAAFADQHGESFEVWIEVDTDGHRSGITPEQDTLLEVGRILHENGVKVGGVMTHAGSSYELAYAGGARRAGGAGTRRLRARGATAARRRHSVPGCERRVDAHGARRRATGWRDRSASRASTFSSIWSCTTSACARWKISRSVCSPP